MGHGRFDQLPDTVGEVVELGVAMVEFGPAFGFGRPQRRTTALVGHERRRRLAATDVDLADSGGRPDGGIEVSIGMAPRFSIPTHVGSSCTTKANSPVTIFSQQGSGTQ